MAGGCVFHAPNGLHVGLITPEAARLMRAAGFQTLRLAWKAWSLTGRKPWEIKCLKASLKRP